MIYQYDGINSYRRYTATGTRLTRGPTYVRTSSNMCLPSDSRPTTTEGNYNYVRHTGFTDHRPTPIAPLPTWWGVVVNATLPLQELIDAIQRGTAVAVTDGSYKDDMGTAAFTFRDSIDGAREITMVHMTPGYTQDMTPYRAEMGGLFGIAAFLGRLHEGHHIPNGQITVACDCRSALDKVMLPQFPHPKNPNFDILAEIYNLRHDTNIQWLPKWVKGHQDDHRRQAELDPWARINIEMDTLAKMHWEKLNNRRPAPFSLHTTTGVWSIWSKRQRITSWDKDTVDQLYFNNAARTYWDQKVHNLEAFDFEAMQLAYKSLSLYYQLRAPKWISRRLPVGARISTWSPNYTSQCPRCGTESETHSHIVTEF